MVSSGASIIQQAVDSIVAQVDYGRQEANTVGKPQPKAINDVKESQTNLLTDAQMEAALAVYTGFRPHAELVLK